MPVDQTAKLDILISQVPLSRQWKNPWGRQRYDDVAFSDEESSYSLQIQLNKGLTLIFPGWSGITQIKKT